jgi:hypothetical protein
LLARTPSSKGGLGCKAYCLHSLVHELALCLAASVYGVALANESRHAATVDMPEVITLTHASPDTWNTLPPVQPKPAVIGSIPMIGDGIGSVMRVRLTGYGRWFLDPAEGWIWIPGSEWAPAWVSWRRGEQRIGWAPQPPDEVFVEIRDNPHYWVFVEPRDFISDRVWTNIEPGWHQTILLQQTLIVNRTVVVHDRGFAVNPGVEPAVIAHEVGKPIGCLWMRSIIPSWSVYAVTKTICVPNVSRIDAAEGRGRGEAWQEGQDRRARRT